MKFTGQDIYDFVARFRSDIYLENISTGTIVSGGNLGLDSNNKIVKATVSGGSTLADLTSFGSAGATTDIAAGDLTMFNAVNDGNPTFSIGSSATDRLEIAALYNSGAQTFNEARFTTYTTDSSSPTNAGMFTFYVHETLKFKAADTSTISYNTFLVTADDAYIRVHNSTASSATQGGKLILLADDGAAMADDHRLGVIEFKGAEDASNNRTVGARIEAMCDAAWSATENGTRLDFYTTDGNASESKVLTLDSDKLATFTGGITAAGTLTMGSTAAINSSGVIQVAAQTVIDHDQLANYAANEHFTQANITTVGTIGTGVWQGTAIAHAYIGTDAIETDNIADAQVTVAKLHADAIQTSGESFADNDTSLMTSAAIDDKINTKYSTSYMVFSAKSTSSYGTNYVFIHANGISESTFSVNSNVDSAGDFGGVTTEEGGSGTDATASVPTTTLENQIPIPETCKLIGFYATTSTTTSTAVGYDTGVGIWHVPESEVNWGGSTAATATLIHKSDSSRHAENTAHGGSNKKKVQKVARMDGTVKTLAAGDIIVPSIFGETSNQQIMATITLVIATPIKTI